MAAAGGAAPPGELGLQPGLFPPPLPNPHPSFPCPFLKETMLLKSFFEMKHFSSVQDR